MSQNLCELQFLHVYVTLWSHRLTEVNLSLALKDAELMQKLNKNYILIFLSLRIHIKGIQFRTLSHAFIFHVLLSFFSPTRSRDSDLTSAERVLSHLDHMSSRHSSASLLAPSTHSDLHSLLFLSDGWFLQVFPLQSLSDLSSSINSLSALWLGCTKSTGPVWLRCPPLGDRWGGDNGGLEKATMGFLAAWWRERVSDEFHFFPVSVYYVPGKCFMLEISREVTDYSSALLGRCSDK